MPKYEMVSEGLIAEAELPRWLNAFEGWCEEGTLCVVDWSGKKQDRSWGRGPYVLYRYSTVAGTPDYERLDLFAALAEAVAAAWYLHDYSVGHGGGHGYCYEHAAGEFKLEFLRRGRLLTLVRPRDPVHFSFDKYQALEGPAVEGGEPVDVSDLSAERTGVPVELPPEPVEDAEAEYMRLTGVTPRGLQRVKREVQKAVGHAMAERGEALPKLRPVGGKGSA